MQVSAAEEAAKQSTAQLSAAESSRAESSEEATMGLKPTMQQSQKEQRQEEQLSASKARIGGFDLSSRACQEEQQSRQSSPAVRVEKQSYSVQRGNKIPMAPSFAPVSKTEDNTM